MKISVIVLTCDRNILLKGCLDSLLLNQRSLPDEIIIVNAGHEDVRLLVKDYSHPGVEIKVIKTDNVSLTSNRNAGIMASTYELIAFTDDDCKVSSNWIEGFRNAYSQNGKIGSVGGRMFDGNSYRLAHNIDEMSMIISDYHDKGNSPYCYYFRTANVCYSKEALKKINFFDENISYKSSDDLSVGLKLLLAGYQNIYHPEIFVRHYGRSTVGKLIKRLFYYGRVLYKVMQHFKGTRLADVYKTQRSILYIIVSTVTGSIRDVYRFGKEKGFLAVLFYSFTMKFFINIGILYERLFRA